MEELMNRPPRSVWIAHYSDWGEFALFETEVEALRHAVAKVMQVREVTLPAVDIVVGQR
jgi:hypothetical protein